MFDSVDYWIAEMDEESLLATAIILIDMGFQKLSDEIFTNVDFNEQIRV